MWDDGRLRIRMGDWNTAAGGTIEGAVLEAATTTSGMGNLVFLEGRLMMRMLPNMFFMFFFSAGKSKDLGWK